MLFADGIFGCSTTRSVTISCEWDAQGQLQANPPDVAIPTPSSGGKLQLRQVHRELAGRVVTAEYAARVPRGHPAPGFFLCTRVVTATKPRIGDPRGGCGPRERRSSDRHRGPQGRETA